MSVKGLRYDNVPDARFGLMCWKEPASVASKGEVWKGLKQRRISRRTTLMRSCSGSVSGISTWLYSLRSVALLPI